MEKIKPCCICVNEPCLETNRCKVIKKDSYTVRCPNCGHSGPCCFDKGESISHWNNIQEAYDEKHNRD